MKLPRLFLACAAAGLTLAAQAVSIDWTAGTCTPGEISRFPGGSYITPDNSEHTSGALRIVATFASTSEAYDNALLGIGADDTTHVGQSLTVWLDGTNLRMSLVNKEASYVQGVDRSIASLADGKQHELVVAVERPSSGTVNAALFVDGVEIATVSGSITGGGWYYWDYVLGNKLNLEEPVSGLSISDASVSFAAATIDDVRTLYTVPEPTALALLALGVAGVALRRRAA